MTGAWRLHPRRRELCAGDSGSSQALRSGFAPFFCFLSRTRFGAPKLKVCLEGTCEQAGQLSYSHSVTVG